MGFTTHLWKCIDCEKQVLYTSNGKHPSINHECITMNINFMEVTIIDGSKHSFRIETLKSFKDMGTHTKIYLDDRPFDIKENYEEFITRLKKYETNSSRMVD
jgi:hypothetical protein